jgi:hypothetical protein
MERIEVSQTRTGVSRWTQWLMPSIEDVLFVAFFVKLLSLGDTFLRDADTAWHIRAGDVILQKGFVPREDVFSYTMLGEPWINHEWLSQVIFSILHRFFGLTGLVILTLLLLCFTFLYFYRFLLELHISLFLSVILTLLAATITSVHWLARPHIFSLLLTLVWYRQLDRYQRTGAKKALYILPPLMMLWVNLHGAYLTGFILLGIYILGNGLQQFFDSDQKKIDEVRYRIFHLFSFTGFCLLTALINPYGYRMLLFPFQFMGSKYIQDYIVEWASPNFHDTLLFSLPLLLLIVVLGFSLRKLSFIEIGLLIFSIHSALYAVRYMPVLAIVAIPIIGSYLQGYFTKGLARTDLPSRVRKILQYLHAFSGRIQANSSYFNRHLMIAVFLLFLLFDITYSRGRGGGVLVVDYPFDETRFPIQAVEFIKGEGITGRMYNAYYFGGYLIYRLYPDPNYRVFIDGRAEMYGDEMLKDFMHIDYLVPDWESILEDYKVTWIIHQAGSQLSAILLEDSSWKLIYADSVANIFVKDIPTYSPLIDEYPNVKPVQSEEQS